MIKKILIVGGLADTVYVFRGRLIAALVEAGIEVHVAASSESDTTDAGKKLKSIGATFHGIRMTRTGTNPYSDLKTLGNLYSLICRIRPDAFLSYTAKAVIYGSIAARLASVPKRFALITGLGYAFQGNGSRDSTRFLVKQLYATALASVDKVFFQNPDDCELFRSNRILRKHTASCIVNGSGVDIEQFAPVSLPTDPIRFLMICRLLGDKGVREYAEAARIVKAKYPNTRFSLVGWIDPHPDAIRPEELDEWQASGMIDFLGRVEDVRPAIADSSVYVLPSYREGTPRSVLEAMSMGRPIITTDAPGCRETVIHGENGFLVGVKSTDEIVTSMLRFIEQPSLIAEMGRKSREIVESKYDVRVVNEFMLREMGFLP